MKKQWSIPSQQLLLCGAVWFGIYAVIRQSAQVVVTAGHQTNTLNQPILALVFVGAVVLAIILVRQVSVDQLWNIFFGVIACTGLFSAFFYSLPQSLPQVALYSISIVFAVIVVALRTKNSSVLVHNAVLAWACIGIARIVGAQFLPLASILAATIVAGYAVFTTTSAARMLPAAQLFFAQQQQFAFIVTPHLPGWLTETVDSQKCIRLVSALDLTLLATIASSFLLRGYMLFYGITGIATCMGVLIVHYARTRAVRVLVLPVMVGCCIVGVYLGANFAF